MTKAAQFEMQLNGELYTFSPLDIHDFEGIRRYVAGQKPNPLIKVAEVYSLYPKEVADEMLKNAYAAATNPMATDTEVLAWIDTFPGKVYALWISAKKLRPSLTLESFYVLVSSIGEESVSAISKKLAAATAPTAPSPPDAAPAAV